MAPPKQALILSGGGANGAYEVGILKALFSGKCKRIPAVEPELFFGTSIGSFNAAFLVSRDREPDFDAKVKQIDAKYENVKAMVEAVV